MTATLDRHAPGPRTDLVAFFRHHGAWAPGVRLFRRVGFRTKALLISAAFALPLALLAWQYFAAAQRDLEFSRLERVGVAYQRAVLPVVDALVGLRSAAVTGGDTDGRWQRELVTALAALDATRAQHGDRLPVDEPRAALVAAVEALPGGPVRDAEALARHGAAIEAALALVIAVNDASNLTLDPELATYYLMAASLDALPQLAGATGALHAVSTLDAAGGSVTPRDVITAELAGDVADARVVSALAHAAREIPGDPAVTGYAEVHDALHRFHELVASGEEGARVDVSARTVLDRLAQVRSVMVDTLDRLLADRIAAREQARGLTALALVASLAAAAYLFIAFGRVLDGGLREVARHIDALRRGDLTTEPRPWGRDEVAGLMVALGTMQGALRGIVREVRGAADGIVSAAGQIAAGSGDLSHRTERSAAALQESASAMETVADAARRQAGATREAAGIAAANAGTARAGGQVVDELGRTMSDIRDASGRIRDITSTIDGIAFQTRILALNAAVEAARAGSQGRGFAVVAGEVRALAQRCSVAAREIGQLIAESVARVEDGLRVADTAGRTMADLVDRAVQVDGILSRVAEAIDEQAAHVGRTTAAVQELDRATQQNAALVEESAAAAGAMDAQARRLSAEVARFELPAT